MAGIEILVTAIPLFLTLPSHWIGIYRSPLIPAGFICAAMGPSLGGFLVAYNDFAMEEGGEGVAHLHPTV